MPINNHPAIFLDRDGVVNVELPEYVNSVNEFKFQDDSLNAIRLLSKLGLPIIIVTNQANIGRGKITPEKLAGIHNYMVEHIRSVGGRIDAIYCCPHTPNDHCDCRKPQPGLLLQAAIDLNIDLSSSYMIGDKISDTQAGQRAGCKSILVLTGRGMEYVQNGDVEKTPPDSIQPDLMGAVEWIRQQEEAKAR